MIRQFALALVASATIGVTAVPAQTVDFGPGGPSVDLRSRGQRERDFQREQVRRDRDDDRGRVSDRGFGGGRDCRTVTVREQDDYGNTVTRRRRECS